MNDGSHAASGAPAVEGHVGQRRRGLKLSLWIGTPLAVALVGVVAASLILIAPGTAVAGVQVGGMTAGAAAAAIQDQLDRTAVELTGAGVDETVTGAQLGATVDAKALAGAAFDEHPMWNVTAWFSGVEHAPITLDAAKAAATLRAVAPSLYRPATDAAIAFDAASGNYTVQAAATGTQVDLDALTASLQRAFASGKSTTSTALTAVPVAPAVSTETAQQAATSLNTMLGTVGFYVGDERTVPIDRATAAGWLTVAEKDGKVAVTADAAAIQKSVDQLPALVNRAPANGSEITDLDGNVLRVDTPAADGRTLGDTAGVAKAFAAQLAAGNGVYKLPVTVAKATMTKVARSIVVDLSDQTTYLYQDGNLVQSYLISSGKAETPTPTGHFAIFAHVRIQDMGCYPGADYCTKDVPWVTYFAPDIAFHGTYWHNNFGHVMSHGCVNMPIDIAQYVYEWAPDGTPVTVQN